MLPECTVTAQRFVITLDEKDASVGVRMTRAVALTLLEQGTFFKSYFPDLRLSAFGGANLHAKTAKQETEEFCQWLKDSLTQENEKPRVRII